MKVDINAHKIELISQNQYVIVKGILELFPLHNVLYNLIFI